MCSPPLAVVPILVPRGDREHTAGESSAVRRCRPDDASVTPLLGRLGRDLGHHGLASRTRSRPTAVRAIAVGRGRPSLFTLFLYF
jgi:hypothetical protein